ncbi:MAG: hypothetical protein A2504_13010 [Bdellovibrionales bacterium RIFOXYD12_FULL_39_22]|nr:MAG: hypothetical protein A2385_00810 [Bdellovibrionales bacterium RIFOXYB1_FULL_39_21]OFZ43548.1 MAG: hypothetical protein A2485_12480 [Bdellovibrionales bacterium RIFOXYC12_FULL_39_17]OFZ44567.1 MAG: hypothetical protein A2404_10170 [Bdellovibrionales bacterium RIFOXYC1_FULL_39_130]OFZ71251.1 MAG: hypothetical protein A2451_11995 [Bdellovibrionales bacterium RIFOXYC2_FULL_39_8]OFZ76326.1 MAG: hypothetical protein A2560_06790 [Bdellovibrionales bacterium RIFOXYD1_FULL_39_84]OFZ94592.1 MAG:
MKIEIQDKLNKLALKKSIPFCYGCYQDAPTGRCNICGSDDLMNRLPGVGCEYGQEWIISHILETELSPVDIEEAFEESIRQIYPEETKVGWMTFDTVTLMKSQDPVSWNIAKSEWESQEEEDGTIISFDNGATYYWYSDLEKFVDDQEA